MSRPYSFCRAVLSPAVTFSLLAALLLAVQGCTLKSGGEGSSAGGKRPAIQMFTPLAEYKAVPLSQSEARDLVRKYSPRGQRLNSWQDLDFPLSQSLAYAQGKSSSAAALDRPGLSVTYGQLADSLRHMRALLPRLESSPELLATEFRWYRLGPDVGSTGYYEPTLEASRTKSAAYPYPLYRVPPDLRSGVAYHSRNAIDRKGALAGRGLEIAWVSSETDAFFLHIQGSGRLRFADGSVTHVLYAGKNNQPYRPLGRIMRDQGLLAPDNISMQSIRKCLEENPQRKAELFDCNPSYVFFREAERGPFGAMGRPLTPWVSLATDRSALPHGSLLFLAVPLPDDSGALSVPYYGLTLPQDTGGAIKGNRIDLFCGPGEQAAHTAGYLDARGAVYVLVKK